MAPQSKETFRTEVMSVEDLMKWGNTKKAKKQKEKRREKLPKYAREMLKAGVALEDVPDRADDARKALEDHAPLLDEPMDDIGQQEARISEQREHEGEEVNEESGTARDTKALEQRVKKAEEDSRLHEIYRALRNSNTGLNMSILAMIDQCQNALEQEISKARNTSVFSFELPSFCDCEGFASSSIYLLVPLAACTTRAPSLSLPDRIRSSNSSSGRLYREGILIANLLITEKINLLITGGCPHSGGISIRQTASSVFVDHQI